MIILKSYDCFCNIKISQNVTVNVIEVYTLKRGNFNKIVFKH